MIIPQEGSKCRIRVGKETQHWQAGKSLIFDDSYLHEVWNDTPEQRVVLFVDFERPLPFPVSVLNRAVIRRIGGSDFVTGGVARIEQLSKQLTP